MPACNKECKAKVYRVRNVVFTNQFPVAGQGEDCRRLLNDNGLARVIETAVSRRASPVEGHTCADGCECDLVGEPRWGRRWIPYTFTATLVRNNCRYPLAGRYEKNSGIMDGVCIDPSGGEDDVGEVAATSGSKSSGKKSKKSRR